MRKAVNENPVIQVVMIGFLGIVVAFLFMTRVMNRDEPAATSVAAPGSEAAVATATPAAVPVAPATAAPTDSATSAPSPAVPLIPTTGFEAGPGLPADVVKAHELGNYVVLLVSKRQGIEDGKLRDEMDRLRRFKDTSVFLVDSNDVADYSRIAQGVDLTRVPALVVVQPPPRGDRPLPSASIAYGFRGPDGVEQAVRDARYEGKQLPYHPG